MVYDPLVALAPHMLSLLGKMPPYRQFGINAMPILRALYLESERNLALLACAKLEDDETPQCCRQLWLLAIRLDASVLENVIGVGPTSGDEAVSKALKKLDGMPILDASSGEIVDAGGVLDAGSVMISDRLHRLYVSINTVRSAASVYLDSEDHEQSGALRDIRFKLRLKNIARSYKSLSFTLSEEFRS